MKALPGSVSKIVTPVAVIVLAGVCAGFRASWRMLSEVRGARGPGQMSDGAHDWAIASPPMRVGRAEGALQFG